MRNYYLLLFLLLFLPLLMIGQDTIMLNAVIVSESSIGERGRSSFERHFDTLTISKMKTVPLSQLLIESSPIFIKSYGPGSVATASFRGTTASHTLVLWNGLPLNSPTLGQVDFNTIPVFFVDDVALRWGSETAPAQGGLGGVVNIENNTRFNKGLLVDVRQSVASFNTYGTFIAGGYSAQNVIFRIKTFRSASDNNFKYLNNALIPNQTMKQKNGDYLNYGIMPEVKMRFGNSLVNIISWNQWNDRNNPQIMPNVGKDNTIEKTLSNFSRNLISYRYFWRDGSIQIKSSLFFEEQKYSLETFSDIGTIVTSIHSKNNSLMAHQIAELSQDLFSSWRLKAKIQWDMDQVKSNNFNDVKQRDIISFFTEIEGNPLKDLDLHLSLRNDVINGKSQGFFPTASATYKLPFFKKLSATLGYSNNYRTPSLNDLYWYPGGNENLVPEKGNTIDFTLKYNHKRKSSAVTMSLGTFYSVVEDWIQWVPTNYRFWTPENVDEVRILGVEMFFNAHISLCKWKFQLSGNFVHSKTTHNEKQLIYIPENHGNLNAIISYKSWQLTYTIEGTDERKTSNSSTEFYAFKLNPYFLNHISLEKCLKKFTISLKINNLTDENYQAVLWRPMPRRNFELVVEWKY